MTQRAALAPAYYRLAVGARIWALLVLGISAASLGDGTSAAALTVLGLVWSVSIAAEWRGYTWLSKSPLEPVLVSAVAARSLDADLSLLLAMAIPPFTGGLLRGVRGVVQALAAELVVVVALIMTRYGTFQVDEASSILTWILTGLGLGLIAAYVQRAVLEKPDDPLAPYREAQVHLRGLLDLSGDLRSGLEPVTLGSRIAVAVRNSLPVEAVAVFVPRGDELTPLVTGAISSAVDQSLLEPMAHRAWSTGRPIIDEERFALPLPTEMGIVAVVTGMLAVGRDVSGLGTEAHLTALARSLRPRTVQLDTALMFARLRDAATADERRRLARDLHDGVAQDIASLGYLVDALGITPTTPGQAESLRRLRERITDVVAQVRMAVQTLRTDAESAESLGAAVSGLARHLSESSGVPIRVTVDETTTRLRPEVEGELLRIAQEAMTNAVRHASASLIDVTCKVAAPLAEITVRDDGNGLGQPREDSYGVAIMQERAELIDADFSIESAERRGTVVTVRVPSRHQSASRVPDPLPDKVSL
ncbi:sensor histidine kinase [Nocardioides coralli]|uniref:sensor histidine kinase n=1 Tax=Nocardioides coralli TaxID=2872154 RepID=UPI001CA44F07|nr:sensor histidine kinase [Nocardioides coralli]QZY28015.1 sensor histidine kinase [Nocardioides coralli]